MKTLLRHYCRNPHCRSKLAEPVSIEAHAFCARGCYDSYFLHRCAVCARRIEREGTCRPCKRSTCRSEFRRNRQRFEGTKWRLATRVAGLSKRASETLILSASKPYDFGDRCLIGPNDPPINILGGYRWPDTPTVEPETLRKITRAEVAGSRPCVTRPLE